MNAIACDKIPYKAIIAKIVPLTTALNNAAPKVNGRRRQEQPLDGVVDGEETIACTYWLPHFGHFAEISLPLGYQV
jgi:hypothetical protein